MNGSNITYWRNVFFFATCNLNSKLCKTVYIIYFIARKTWDNFVHRQKTTVTTRSLIVNKDRNEGGAQKVTVDQAMVGSGVDETQTSPYSPAKQLNNDKHRVVMLKWSSADERRTLSVVWFYKNKHVPCFIPIICSVKYMFYY